MCKLVPGSVYLLSSIGEHIVHTTKTSISLNDSLLVFLTLTQFFTAVGWLVTSVPKVFIESDSLPAVGKFNWSRARCVK